MFSLVFYEPFRPTFASGQCISSRPDHWMPRWPTDRYIDGARENDGQSRELVSVDTSLILAKPVKDKKDKINFSPICIYKSSTCKQAFTFVAPAVLRLYRQSQRNGPTFKTTARGLPPPPT